MRAIWKALIAGGVLVAALLAVNAVVLGSQTKQAAPTAADGEILELSAVDLQVVEWPARRPDAEGGPIVLLHCYGCSLRWWDRLAPLLATERRVVAVDLIGFGGSEKPQAGYAIPEQAAAVAEALSRLGVEAATVVGHSMGGDVAIALAERASQLVDRVAVLGTPSDTDQASLPFLARLTYVPVLGEALWRVRTDGMIRQGYESAFAPGFDLEGAFDDPDQVIADNLAMTYTSYEKAHAAAQDFTDAAANAARITAVAVPFLAVLGAEDEIVDTPAAESSYAAVPGAQVRVLDGVGHSPNLEAPEDTAETLLRFAGATGGR